MPQPDFPGDPFARHRSTAGELKARIEAERSATPFVALRDPDGRLQLVLLADDVSSLMIGRREGAEILVDWDAQVSGIHAELQRLGAEWAIVDDGLSTNGTFVNGQRVVGRRRLRDGDRVRVGETIIAFTSRETAASEATRTAGNSPDTATVSEPQRQLLVALCRPLLIDGGSTTPASNRQIALELFISEQTVKARLRPLFDLFGLGELSQNEKRGRLAHKALALGLVSARDV